MVLLFKWNKFKLNFSFKDILTLKIYKYPGNNLAKVSAEYVTLSKVPPDKSIWLLASDFSFKKY